MFIAEQYNFSHSRRCNFTLTWDFSALSVSDPFLLLVDLDTRSAQVEVTPDTGASIDGTTAVYTIAATELNVKLPKNQYWMQIYASVDDEAALVFEGTIDITNDDAVEEQITEFTFYFDSENYILTKSAATSEFPTTTELSDKFAPGSVYETPIADPETGDDVTTGFITNAYGLVNVDEFPKWKRVRRNYRRHTTVFGAGFNLSYLFTLEPTNLGNYLYLNGTDWYKFEKIEDMTDIPEGVQGQAYLIVDTADKFGSQVLLLPTTGEMFRRSKLESGTITPWTKIGLPDNIPQENVVDLIQDLLDLSNRIFSVEETNFLQQQIIDGNSANIGAIAQINNIQDTRIQNLTNILDDLLLSLNNYATKQQFAGGLLGASLVKTGDQDGDFAFKRAHGVTLKSFALPQAKVGEAYGFNIPITDFIKPEFIWSDPDIRVEFITFAEQWLNYNYTSNGGITLWGEPAQEEKVTVFALIYCNGFVSTYPLLVESVSEISQVSNLIATLTQAFTPIVDLAWSFNGVTPDNFYVYRRENGGAFILLDTVSASTFAYSDTSANSGKNYDYQVKSYKGATFGSPSNIASVQTPAVVTDVDGGLYGRYYSNINLSGSVYDSRVDTQVNYNWSTSEPISGIGLVNYSVRWTGYVKFPYSGQVKFRIRSDDGIRVWVDGIQVVNEWRTMGVSPWPWVTTLEAGVQKSITIEYFQGDGNAEIYFEYENQNGVYVAVPSGYLIPEDVIGESLDAPVMVSATAIDTDTIETVWTYTGDVDTFTQRRGPTSSGPWTEETFLGAVRDRQTDSLSANTKYYFQIRSNFDGRSSGWSNMVSATTQSGVTLPPDDEAGDITASPFELHKRSVGWNSPSFNYSNMTESDEVISIAVQSGVDFAVIYPAWWEMEQSEGNFNFDNLWWQILKQAERGLGFAVALPSMFPYVPPANPNPFNGWGMASGNSQKRWNGTAWTDSAFISASSCAYLSYTNAIVCRDGGYMLDAVNGAMGSMASGPFVYAQRRLAARLADWIESKPEIKAICHGVGYFDGGSTETAFTYYDKSVKFSNADLQNPINNGAFQDGDWSSAFLAEFSLWCQTKYISVSALSSAWQQSVPTFGSIASNPSLYYPPIYNASGNTGTVDYSNRRSTKDWFEFVVSKKKELYTQVVNAIKNPSSFSSGLASPSVPLRTIAYWTESLTAAQGFTAGAAAVDMIRPFDAVWSSSGSNDGSRVKDSHFKAFAFRADEMRASFAHKDFAQELDTDLSVYADGGRVGPSKTMACTFPRGATTFLVTFFRTPAEWNEANYRAENGDTVSFAEDLRRGMVNHVRGKYRTLPTPSATLTFNREQVFNNVVNPNNIIEDWSALVNPSQTGLSNVFVDVKFV